MSPHSEGSGAAPSYGFQTLAIHAGQEPDPVTGAVVTPIYQTSTFAQDGVGGLRGGYEYGRTGNPTRTALQHCLAALEAGSDALVFASGLAAEDTLLRVIAEPGAHLVLSDDPYGGTFRLVDSVCRPWGLDYTTAALRDLDVVARAITPQTVAVYCETPSNPLLGVVDIAALASLAHEHGVLLIVDNTFASPYLQQPLALGADVVVHSTTKYIGGHSDVVGGALITSDTALAERLTFHQNAIGAVPGPFDCWLTLRGLKTLAVRMERHCDNTERVVAALQNHAAVAGVRYPGLSEHPDHDIAAKQMRRFGGMVSFGLHGGEYAALRVCERTRLFTLGESLGGVESLIEHPARMTHASTADSTIAVPTDLVRISVGIEDADDLIADLVQALDRVLS